MRRHWVNCQLAVQASSLITSSSNGISNTRSTSFSSKLAYVEFYDPDESSMVELATRLSLGTGHDQKRSIWHLRFDIGVVDPNSDWIPIGTNGLTNQLKTGSLIGLRIEHMLTRQIGIEYGMFRSRKLSAKPATFGSTQFGGATLNGFSPYSLGLNLHITPERVLDFYLGVQVANADDGDLSISVTEDGMTTTIPIKSDFGWGVLAGVDIPLGDHGWIAHLGARFMRFKFQYATNPVRRQSFKTYLLYFGLGYRF